MKLKKIGLIACMLLVAHSVSAQFELNSELGPPTNVNNALSGKLEGSKPSILKIGAAGKYIAGEDLVLDFTNQEQYHFFDIDLDKDKSISNFDWYCFNDSADILIPEILAMEPNQIEPYFSNLLGTQKAKMLGKIIINGDPNVNGLPYFPEIANDPTCQNFGFSIVAETTTGYPERKNTRLIVPDTDFYGALDVNGKPSYIHKEIYTLPANLSTPKVDANLSNPYRKANFSFPALALNDPNNFPSTGFKGAEFRVNTVDKATDLHNQLYRWEMFQLNGNVELPTTLAVVDDTGRVSLTEEPLTPTVMRVKATLKEPANNLIHKYGYIYDFKIKTWFDPALPMPEIPLAGIETLSVATESKAVTSVPPRDIRLLANINDDISKSDNWPSIKFEAAVVDSLENKNATDLTGLNPTWTLHITKDDELIQEIELSSDGLISQEVKDSLATLNLVVRSGPIYDPLTKLITLELASNLALEGEMSIDFKNDLIAKELDSNRVTFSFIDQPSENITVDLFDRGPLGNSYGGGKINFSHSHRDTYIEAVAYDKSNLTIDNKPTEVTQYFAPYIRWSINDRPRSTLVNIDRCDGTVMFKTQSTNADAEPELAALSPNLAPKFTYEQQTSLQLTLEFTEGIKNRNEPLIPVGTGVEMKICNKGSTSAYTWFK